LPGLCFDLSIKLTGFHLN